MRLAAAGRALRSSPALVLALAVSGCGVGSPLSSGKPKSDASVAIDVKDTRDAGSDAAVSNVPGNNTQTGRGGSKDASVDAEPAPGRPCGTGLGCDPTNLGGETCQSLGFGSGRLLCDPLSCTFEVGLCTGLVQRRDGGIACGVGGACDPTDLGGQSCESLGMGVGVLTCDPQSCTFDTSLCAGGNGVGGMMGAGGAMGGDTTGGTTDIFTLLGDLLGGLFGGLFGGGSDAGMGDAGAPNDAG